MHSNIGLDVKLLITLYNVIRFLIIYCVEKRKSFPLGKKMFKL